MRLFEFGVAFFLLLIFAAEYPMWAEAVGTFLFVLIALFIVDRIVEILSRLQKVIVIDAKGIRVKLSRSGSSRGAAGG